MPKPQFQSETTKREAYRLVHDPTRLFNLLYLKYGDIEEDYNIFYANQVLFNEFSHFNTLYKEHLHNAYEEFIKRFYNFKEIKKRMTKLNEYYKNYLKFFSKPMFINSFYNKLVNQYYDSKAEIFYVNNLTEKKVSKSKSIKKTKKKGKNNAFSDSSLSSLDNDTENDIIFNKRIKNMIDNNLNTNSCTITLDINTKNDLDYINKKNISDSFVNIVNSIANYKTKDVKEKKIGENNKINKNEVIKKNIIYEKKQNKNFKKINIYNNIVINKENELNKKIEEKIINENINNDNNNIYLINSKNNEKEKNIILDKEKINKPNFNNKNQLIKLVIKSKNIIENNNNNLEKLEEMHNININNKNFPPNIINPINLSPLNNQEQKVQNKRKASNNLFNKKKLCIGFNFLYKGPLDKIKEINFYSPQNNKYKKNTFNKHISPLNYNQYKIKKAKNISLISENIINPGFISINIENSGKMLYNKKYKLLPKNLKNNIQKIKININSPQNNLNILSINNFQIKSPQNKRNRSTQDLKDINYLTLKDLNHNLSGDNNLNIIGNNLKPILNNTINKNNKLFSIQKKYFKQISPSLKNIEEKKRLKNDTLPIFEPKNVLSNIIEKNCSKKTQTNQNKYLIEDINKFGGNNINKKLFYPINFKKTFNKKEIIKDKDIKLGLNII